MAPRGRPPSAKTLVDRQLGRDISHPNLPPEEGFNIPNHSGDHSAGRVDTTPTTDLQLVNKKYVDDQIALLSDTYVPYTGAIKDVDIGNFKFDVGTFRLDGNVFSNSGGLISTDNENLTGTGTLNYGAGTFDSITIDNATISSSSGQVSFTDDNILTTGDVTVDVGKLICKKGADTSSISQDNIFGASTIWQLDENGDGDGFLRILSGALQLGVFNVNDFNTASVGRVVNLTTVTDTYTILVTDRVIHGNKVTAFTMTLPLASAGRVFYIKNINTGAVTVDGNGTETVEGDLTQTLNKDESIEIIGDGSNWHII